MFFKLFLNKRLFSRLTIIVVLSGIFIINLSFTYLNLSDSCSKVQTIKPWKVVTIDSLYAGAWIIIDDIDNDKHCEIISVKNFSFYPEIDEHYTSSIIVTKIDGNILWKWGNPSIGDNKLHSDVACQVIDWDCDGKKEVVIASDCAIIVIDGQTGKEKRRFSIPKYASDCILFANLTNNKKLDIIVRACLNFSSK